MAAEDYSSISSATFPAFRFVVDVDGERIGAFTECTLPVIEWDMEEIKEGGLNSYPHQLPGRQKAARVTLKNGVAKSKLVDWYMNTMKATFKRKKVTISLLDSKKSPVMVWDLKDTLPVKWTGPQLKSDANAVAIQTLDLICGEITVT